MKLPGTALIIFILILPACGNDDPASPGGSGGDTTPPSAVSDLHIVSSTDTTMTVAWTAPGDDGDQGTADRYAVRHAPDSITEGTWATCTALAGVPDPEAAGTEQSLTIRNPGGTSLHVAMKTADEADNWSDLSNGVSGSFPPAGGIQQLTSSGYNSLPCLNNGYVTWIYGDGWDEDIHIANLNDPLPSPTPLTDDGGEKDHVSNHGNELVVWQGRPDNLEDWEIYVYSTTSGPEYTAHTDNSIPDMYPVVASAGDFAWLQGSILFEDVMYWDQTDNQELIISSSCCPTSEYSAAAPAAHDGQVVWRAWHRATSGPHSTYLWENGLLTDLSAEVEANIAHHYSIHDGELAYEYSGNPTQVAYWDGATAQVVATGIEPSLHNGRIAFTFWDGHDYEIRYWNGAQVIEITDNDDNDGQPSLWGDWLVWVGRPGGGPNQIFYMELN
ncbi:MAG: hypothetical protein GF417_02695 [Candidatus Latescibacteria bacterium]|nr:hypothetical protein [bacterium]MBD3423338.1 hypothetical protein [Candidatus Latescibacterota bacterium]